MLQQKVSPLLLRANGDCKPQFQVGLCVSVAGYQVPYGTRTCELELGGHILNHTTNYSNVYFIAFVALYTLT